MSGTIWAVSSGDYSDYRVNAVFSSREAAELYALRFNEACGRGGEFSVETFDLDPEAPEEGMRSWWVRIRRDGDITEARENTYVSEPSVCWYQHRGSWLVCCFARDREHALKIAGEKRQEALAAEALSVPSESKEQP